MTDDVLMFLLGISSANTISDDLTILQVNCTQEKPCALRKMFCKLDVRRKSIVTTGAVPAMKPEATAIYAPQDGRWKITVSFDGRRFCVPKFRH